MQIIPIASGKGGVGKSLLSANLAIALGEAGKNVVLVDLDLGASNLHLVLGEQGQASGVGTFLTGLTSFEEIVHKTSYKNVSFIPGDTEIPGLTALSASQKTVLSKKITSLDTDYVIIDLGAGTHLSVLDFFLLSPQGIIVSSPTVTSVLNAYLFLKSAVFRLMSASFAPESPARSYLNEIRKDLNKLQHLYIPKLMEKIKEIDPNSAEIFSKKMQQFHPRLVMNMIETPKDADKAIKIRRSCSEYLNLDLEHLGVIYRDSVQDISLAARLPAIKYKPQALLSQAVYRIADKILSSEDVNFTSPDFNDETFQTAGLEANLDFETKMSSIEELVGNETLTTADLIETVKSQQYEIRTLKNENQLLKHKLTKAAEQGFKI